MGPADAWQQCTTTFLGGYDGRGVSQKSVGFSAIKGRHENHNKTCFFFTWAWNSFKHFLKTSKRFHFFSSFRTFEHWDFWHQNHSSWGLGEISAFVSVLSKWRWWWRSRDPFFTPKVIGFFPRKMVCSEFSRCTFFTKCDDCDDEIWSYSEIVRVISLLSCVFGHSYVAKEDEKPTVAKAEDEAILGFADGIYSLFWSHHIEKAMSSEWKNVEIERWWWPIAFHPRGALRVFLGSFIEWVDSIHDVRICFALKPFGHVVVLFARNKVCVYHIWYNMLWYIDYNLLSVCMYTYIYKLNLNCVPSQDASDPFRMI